MRASQFSYDKDSLLSWGYEVTEWQQHTSYIKDVALLLGKLDWGSFSTVGRLVEATHYVRRQVKQKKLWFQDNP